MANGDFVSNSMTPERSDPTICMPTFRRFEHAAYQAYTYEAQDVLADVSDLDLIPLEPSSGFKVRDFVQQRLAWRDPTGTFAKANPGLRPIALHKDYDLFIAHCQTVRELLYVNGVKGWKERAKRSVCFLAELYTSEVRESKNLLSALRNFDFIFTEFRDSAEPIAEVVGRPCFSLPPAVDALRFAPDPDGQARVVDVYSIGRRRKGIHLELLQASRSNEIFYIYDTFAGNAASRVQDYRAHRDLVANIAKRSLCFVVAPAKWDETQQTQGQVAIANRYFEGAAAGAVLIGQVSHTDEFRELFDWEDVVVHIAEDGSDARAVVRMLKGQPERCAEIGRRNAVQTILRHDWCARWRRVFEVTGTPIGPSMQAREARLKALASAVGTS